MKGDLDRIIDGLILFTVEGDGSPVESQAKTLRAEARARTQAAAYFERTAAADVGDFVEWSTARQGGEEFDALDQVGLARAVPAEQDGQRLEQVDLRAREILEIDQGMHDGFCVLSDAVFPPKHRLSEPLATLRSCHTRLPATLP